VAGASFPADVAVAVGVAGAGRKATAMIVAVVQIAAADCRIAARFALVASLALVLIIADTIPFSRTFLRTISIVVAPVKSVANLFFITY